MQILRSDLRGDQAPILAAVGPMQFEVATHRLEHEFATPVHLDFLEYNIARRTTAADAPELAAKRDVEVLQRTDGVYLALFKGPWHLKRIEQDLPNAMLEPLVAGTD